MVRFARRGKEQKKTEEPTRWDEMFENKDKKTSSSQPTESNDMKNFKDKNFNKNFKNNKKFNKNHNNNFNIEKIETLVDKTVLEDLKKLRDQNKISKDEYLMMVKKEAKSNQRRLSRAQERADARVCFKCRKTGHHISYCPEIKKDNDQGTGICYKCGTTEHSAVQCKVKVAPGTYPYAKCFICNETGHISKQCPDNPRGLYPNGGACKNCGSVEHFAKDCPTLKDGEIQEPKTITKLKPTDNVEALEEDFDSNKKINNNKNNKKIVKF